MKGPTLPARRTPDTAGGLLIAAYWLRQLALLVSASTLGFLLGGQCNAAIEGGEELSWSPLWWYIAGIILLGPSLLIATITLLDRLHERPQPISAKPAMIAFGVAAAAFAAVGFVTGFPS